MCDAPCEARNIWIVGMAGGARGIPFKSIGIGHVPLGSPSAPIGIAIGCIAVAQTKVAHIIQVRCIEGTDSAVTEVSQQPLVKQCEHFDTDKPAGIYICKGSSH